MNDLGLDISQLLPWFTHEQESPYVLIRVLEEHAATWADVLGIPVRRCYVSDELLDEHAVRTARPKGELLAAKLPDRGATMAGDFGEILVLFYHAAQEHPSVVIGPKKWRLKQDRRKPISYSDVIHFILPSWPNPSARDCILCSEVKTKSTSGNWSPITDAIKDCEKDRTSRLAKTLAWLKERALYEDLGSISVPHLERFIKATDYPPAQKRFHAVAVVCSSLVQNELSKAPDEAPVDYNIVVIAVPNLKQHYEAVFDAVLTTVAETGV